MNGHKLEERVERERIAHTERDVLGDNQKVAGHFSHTHWYPSRVRLNSRYHHITQDIAGKVILDYGCGRGHSSRDYLSRGATVYGIDISAVYIADAEQAALAAGYSEDRFNFRVMDAHAMDFPDNMFDMVVGMAILHHLDAEVAMSEINRVLKPGGQVALVEPLADNPFLILYRYLTPHLRTADEKPFSRRDIQGIITQHKWRPDLSYAGVIEAPVAMLTSLLMPKRYDNIFLRFADRIERWMHRHDILSSWNQVVLIRMYKQ